MAFIKAVNLILFVIWCKCSLLFGSESPQLDNGQLLSNLDKIVENVNTAKTSWTAGQNFAPGLSADHLRSLVSQFDPLSDISDDVRSCNCDLSVTKDAPEEFDARQKWRNCPSMTHIPNQGACSSSWAVAAAGVIADRQCVATNGAVNNTMSAQQLLSCCSQCGIGCGGGWPRKAFQFYQKHGVVTGGDYNSHEGCQPFDIKPVDQFDSTNINEDETPECVKQCTNKQYPKKLKKDLHFGEGVITPCCCWIKDTLEKDGPATTSMVVYEDFFAYKSGIYRHIQGKKVGYQTVRLLGWGKENGVPYWLAANSWGKDWGENGFFRILRAQGECQFDFGFVAPIPKIKKSLSTM